MTSLDKIITSFSFKKFKTIFFSPLTKSVLFILKNSETAYDALRKSIWLGGDVDSVASITTGILAGKNGLQSIPKFMIEQVEGVPYFQQIAKAFEKI